MIMSAGFNHPSTSRYGNVYHDDDDDDDYDDNVDAKSPPNGPANVMNAQRMLKLLDRMRARGKPASQHIRDRYQAQLAMGSPPSHSFTGSSSKQTDDHDYSAYHQSKDQFNRASLTDVLELEEGDQPYQPYEHTPFEVEYYYEGYEDDAYEQYDDEYNIVFNHSNQNYYKSIGASKKDSSSDKNSAYAANGLSTYSKQMFGDHGNIRSLPSRQPQVQTNRSSPTRFYQDLDAAMMSPSMLSPIAPLPQSQTPNSISNLFNLSSASDSQLMTRPKHVDSHSHSVRPTAQTKSAVTAKVQDRKPTMAAVIQAKGSTVKAKDLFSYGGRGTGCHIVDKNNSDVTSKSTSGNNREGTRHGTNPPARIPFSAMFAKRVPGSNKANSVSKVTATSMPPALLPEVDQHSRHVRRTPPPYAASRVSAHTAHKQNVLSGSAKLAATAADPAVGVKPIDVDEEDGFQSGYSSSHSVYSASGYSSTGSAQSQQRRKFSRIRRTNNVHKGYSRPSNEPTHGSYPTGLVLGSQLDDYEAIDSSAIGRLPTSPVTPVTEPISLQQQRRRRRRHRGFSGDDSNDNYGGSSHDDTTDSDSCRVGNAARNRRDKTATDNVHINREYYESPTMTLLGSGTFSSYHAQQAHEHTFQQGLRHYDSDSDSSYGSLRSSGSSRSNRSNRSKSKASTTFAAAIASDDLPGNPDTSMTYVSPHTTTSPRSAVDSINNSTNNSTTSPRSPVMSPPMSPRSSCSPTSPSSMLSSHMENNLTTMQVISITRNLKIEPATCSHDKMKMIKAIYKHPTCRIGDLIDRKVGHLVRIMSPVTTPAKEFAETEGKQQKERKKLVYGQNSQHTVNPLPMSKTADTSGVKTDIDKEYVCNDSLTLSLSGWKSFYHQQQQQLQQFE
jgi:hypothetical protein